MTPDTWTATPVAALAAFRNGYPFKPEDRGAQGVPIVRIEQLLNSDSEPDLFDGQVPPANRIDDGSLIFSWSGTLAVRFWDRGPAALNQHLFRVDPTPRVDVRWLRWALEEAIGRMTPLMHGSAMTHITRRVLWETRVRVPPLDVQRRTADYLDAETVRIESLVDMNRSVAELLQERRRCALLQLFEAAEERVPLRYLLAQRPSYGILKPEQVGEGVPVLRIVDVHSSGRVSLEAAIRVPVEQSQEFARTILQAGDVVVSVVGTLGRAGVIPDSVAGANVSRALARLVPADVDPHWLAGWIRSPEFERLVDEVTAGAAQRVLNMEDIVEFEVPVFQHDDEQLAAVGELERIDAQTENALAALNRQRILLQERRQALIAAAVTGELEV